MPVAFESRLYAGPSDLEDLLRFVQAVRSVERMTDYPSITNLPEFLELPQNKGMTRLWLAGDQTVAFAYVDVFKTLRFDIDWQELTPELENEIIAWGDECLVRIVAGSDGPRELIASCYETDVPRLAFLERHRFLPLADSIVHMARSLAEPVASPRVPAGFSIRAVRGEEEADALATLHRNAFGTQHMTTERRLAMMRTPHYEPTFDQVAIAPDGAPVAYGMGSVSVEENRLMHRYDCYADLFATHPTYRGQGLAQALMLTILRLLQERGFGIARLSTGSNNPAMQRVAFDAGFYIEGRTLRLGREVA